MAKAPFTAPTKEQIEKAYDCAKAQYKALGIDTDKAIATLQATPISLHCWQGDDVKGFEVHEGEVSGGGIMAIGNYPGPAMNADMLRKDAEKAFSLIPGTKRFNLHAIYAETDGKVVDRDAITPKHFTKWMKWSKDNKVALDFNPTFFAHPKANSGYTLSNPAPEIRKFWIDHDKACRRIAEAFGKNQGCPAVVNHWMPDGAKDQPIDRLTPRKLMAASLDEIFAEKVNPKYCKDAVESKLFGLGSEDYVVGSHEFFMGYAMTRKDIMICLDMGHFHPTENIYDKISSILNFKKELLLHVSRGIRWDSDHVVILNDDLRCLFQQVVRGNFLKSINIALDFFDASINRIGAWVIGTRATQKAILAALLEPSKLMADYEAANDGAVKLALLEELKTYPLGAVWNMFCLSQGVPAGAAWLNDMIDYDRKVIKKR
ncbi:MAG: L-rhamnose isomerase [Victivallales bacterium]|nr:L-rhamnose isomerase [Victivallales bacterium]